MIKAKVGITLVVIAVAATGGTYVYKNFHKFKKNKTFGDILQTVNLLNEIKIITENEPEKLSDDDLKYIPYSNSNSFSESKDKFGGKYGKLLADAYSSNEEDWWKKNWEKKKAKIKSEDSSFKDFANKTDSDSNLINDIKNKCKEIYKKEEEKIDNDELFNTWLLCSPLSNIPQNIIGFRLKYLNKFATSDKNNNIFLEDRPANKNAWEELYEKFLKASENEQTKAKTEKFKEVKVAYKRDQEISEKPSTQGTVLVKDNVQEKALNQVCSEAYIMTKEEVEKNTNYKDDIMAFCTVTTVS